MRQTLHNLVYNQTTNCLMLRKPAFPLRGGVKVSDQTPSVTNGCRSPLRHCQNGSDTCSNASDRGRVPATFISLCLIAGYVDCTGHRETV